MANHTFEERFKVTIGVDPQIPNSTTAVTGGAVSMAKYNNAAIICALTDRTQYGSNATFQIAQGTNSTQFSTVMLKTVTLSSNTQTAQIDTIEVRAEELSDGYTYIRPVVTMAATATGQEISAQVVQFNPRFMSVS